MEETVPEIVEPLYTDDELFCLAAVIYNEAGSDFISDEHQEMVGYVVLNRVNHPAYPNSIREVIEQPGQYSGMSKGVHFFQRGNSQAEENAKARAYEAARRVLENRNNIPIPANVVYQAQGKQGSGVYKKLGNTYFCYRGE